MPSDAPIAAAPTSPWSPLRIPMFRALWIASLASNVGAWMHNMGAGWLMTSLSPSPVMVALVQTATTLPIFLLAMPAGALADIIDRRRYLIVIQGWLALVAALLGLLTLGGATTAWLLLGLTFAMGTGTALMMPAWAAVTPELVPRSTLHPAIALNSLGINVARAVGPVIAGIVISFAGTGAVFVLNALSYAGVILVLARWRRQIPLSELPAERFLGAVRTGLRFARHAPALQAAVARGMGFFVFASASWALLPLIAKHLPAGGPQAFGLLSGSIGAGAVAGALLLPAARARFSRDALVAGATLLYAAALLALATIDRLWALSLAMAASGVAWITVLSSLQVAAQMALPNWVRSRGLAVFMTVFQGSMALGSLLWGQLASMYGVGPSLAVAATGAVIAVGLTWRWRISGFDDVDLSPSMHWPAPAVHDGVTPDRGPVLITIQYRVRGDRRTDFLRALAQLGQSRRRNGAYAWGLFEHAQRPGEFIETFNDESWLDHLRQHERVSHAERALQADIRACLIDGSEPRVTHYVAPQSSMPAPGSRGR